MKAAIIITPSPAQRTKAGRSLRLLSENVAGKSCFRRSPTVTSEIAGLKVLSLDKAFSDFNKINLCVKSIESSKLSDKCF